MSSTIDDLVQKYLDMWNEPDARRRRAIVDALCAEDCVYIDPNIALAGRDALDSHMVEARKRFEGLVFTLAGPANIHHDQAFFRWRLGPPGAPTPVATGVDVAVFEKGHLRQLYGFVDKATA